MIAFDLSGMLATLDVDEDYPIGAVCPMTPCDTALLALVFVRDN